MADPKCNPEELLEALLDGQLDGEEQRQARQMIGADTRLSEQLRLQQRIDETLRGAFAAPEPPPIPATGAAAGAQPATPAQRSSTRRRVMLAAVGLAGAAAWAAVLGPWLIGRQQPVYNQRLVDVYRGVVSTGFEPLWVCDDDDEFARTFRERQGQALVLAGLPDDVQMVGLSYLSGVTEQATTMLARVGGEPVIVVVLRANEDPGRPTGLDEATGLYVHRTQRVGLVFYEVSPLADARVTPSFQAVE